MHTDWHVPPPPHAEPKGPAQASEHAIVDGQTHGPEYVYLKPLKALTTSPMSVPSWFRFVSGTLGRIWAINFLMEPPRFLNLLTAAVTSEPSGCLVTCGGLKSLTRSPSRRVYMDTGDDTLAHLASPPLQSHPSPPI